MASTIQFNHFKANLHQTLQNLPTMVTKNRTITNITTPFKPNVGSLSNVYSPLANTHLKTRTEKSLEPSLSSSSTTRKSALKIGIIGFGNFGQFIGETFKKQGHNVIATSRSDYSEYCHEHGFGFYTDVDGLCDAQPDIVLVSSSILATENIVKRIPFHKVKPGTIFADVLSVKNFPRNLFLKVVPPEFGILCTHPMFGPKTAKNNWEGSRFVYEKVRIMENNIQDLKCTQFLSIFENEGCRMVEMSCEEHDRYAASSQFITHTIGRILANLDLQLTPVDTKGYETLLKLSEIYSSHDFDLYYGMFAYNVHAKEQIKNLEKAFDIVKQKLFERLRDGLRKQMAETVSIRNTNETHPRTYLLPKNEKVQDLSSFVNFPCSQVNQDESLWPREEFGATK